MPNPGAKAPLRKITLNLFESDVKSLKELHGTGWSTELRDIIHTHVITYTEYQIKYRKPLQKKPKTLGDLDYAK